MSRVRVVRVCVFGFSLLTQTELYRLCLYIRKLKLQPVHTWAAWNVRRVVGCGVCVAKTLLVVLCVCVCVRHFDFEVKFSCVFVELSNILELRCRFNGDGTQRLSYEVTTTS